MEQTAKECGKCGGTGEICYSSTSYGPCPECVERNQQSAALHESRVEKCPECGNGPDNPREDSIERMLHCGSQFHPCNRPEAHPEPRTVEEALALVTGGPDDYCDPKAQPEPEQGTAHLPGQDRKFITEWNKWTAANDPEEWNAQEIADYFYSLAEAAPSPLPVREQSELVKVAKAAIAWIDAVPAAIRNSLPTMPGFDRDWADDVITSAIAGKKEG